MDFKFDFLVEEKEGNQTNENFADQKTNEIRPAKKILLNKPLKRGGIVDSIIIANEKLKKYRNPIDTNTESEVIEIARSLDLKSGVYEGGFKLWECALDLIEFLLKKGEETLQGKLILELGCGHGLPAIMCLKHGANVHFQDYNFEVIESLTIPTALLNCSNEIVEERAQFFSGDWDTEMMGNSLEHQYDIILTSDTIYNVQYYPKLYRFFQNHLKKDGIVFVAAKTFYFGVGGSVAQFKKIMEEGELFSVSELIHIEDGSSNVRDIISVSWRKK